MRATPAGCASFPGARWPDGALPAVQEAVFSVVAASHRTLPDREAALPLLWHVTAACRLAAACKALLLRCGAVGGPINHALTGAAIEVLLSSGCSLAQMFAEPGSAEGSEQAAAQLLEAQLQTMAVCLVTGAHVGMHVVAPERVANWLAAMPALLSRLQAAPGDASVKDILEQAQLCHLPAVCHTLFTSGTYRELDAPLQRRGVTGQLVAQLAPAVSRLAVLLSLPPERRPPGITWAAARPLAALFTVLPLNGAVEQWLGQASSSQLVALLAGAAQLVAQLPAEQWPEGLPAAADEHAATATTLCLCLGMLGQKAAFPRAARALGSAQRKRLAPTLLAAVAQLPGVLQLMAAGLGLPAAPQQHNSDVLRIKSAASGQGVSLAVSSVSSLTALLQGWFDDDASSNPDGQPQPVPLLRGIGDALPWARAATAALRCGPALAAIDRRLDQLPGGRPPLSPGDVPSWGVLEQLLLLTARVVTAVSACADAATLPLPPGCPPLAELRAVVWSLHTAGCRFIHWAAADGWCRLVHHPPLVRSVLRVLNESIKAQFDLHTVEQDNERHGSSSGSRAGSGGGSGGGGAGGGGSSVIPRKLARTCKELEATCAAHWPAVQALAAACNLQQIVGVPGCSKLAISLAVCMGKGPVQLSTDADLPCMFEGMLGLVPRTPSTRSTHYSLVFLAAELAPRLAALLVTSGRSEAMTRELQGIDPTQLASVRMPPGDFISPAWRITADALCLEVVELISRAGLPPATIEALRTPAIALGELLVQHPGARAAQVRRKQLPLMKELLKLLQQVWELPEQQEAARLETAQAAATRACAYLRCANVGGGGGPAAGQGSGSSRCSACRVAWYCGESCSHADWRGPTGHRKSCKALAAAKAARRQAVVDAAAAEAEGEAAEAAAAI